MKLKIWWKRYDFEINSSLKMGLYYEEHDYGLT